jgi:hypothetical protein
MRSYLFILLSTVLLACQPQKKPTTDTISADPFAPIASGTTSPAINPYAPVDISPMDMSYWPVDYPKLRLTGDRITLPLARVIYSPSPLARA